MNRGRITLFAMLAAVTIIAAVFASFYMARRADSNVPPIVLPPIVSANPDEGTVTGDIPPAPESVSITAENLAAVILALEQPEEYSATYRMELFWDGGSAKYDRKVYTRGDMSRVDGGGEYRIIAGAATYMWREGERQAYKGATGEFSADDAIAIPTYKELVSVASEDILLCYYTEYEEEPCVYAETTDTIGQTVKWWIMLSDGLLRRCETWSGDMLVISREAVIIQIGEVSSDVFLLPDGNMATAE